MSKLSEALHAVAAKLRSTSAPQSVNAGKVNVVAGKFEDMARTVADGLSTADRSFLDTIIQQHGGILAGVIQAKADPIIDQANDKLEDFAAAAGLRLDVLVGAAEAKLSARIKDLFDGHPDFDGLPDRVADAVVERVQAQVEISGAPADPTVTLPATAPTGEDKPATAKDAAAKK